MDRRKGAEFTGTKVIVPESMFVILKELDKECGPGSKLRVDIKDEEKLVKIDGSITMTLIDCTIVSEEQALDPRLFVGMDK